MCLIYYLETTAQRNLVPTKRHSSIIIDRNTFMRPSPQGDPVELWVTHLSEWWIYRSDIWTRAILDYLIIKDRLCIYDKKNNYKSGNEIKTILAKQIQLGYLNFAMWNNQTGWRHLLGFPVASVVQSASDNCLQEQLWVWL